MSRQLLRTYRVYDKTLAITCDSSVFFSHVDCFLRPLATKLPSSPDYRLGIFQAKKGTATKIYFCCPELGLAAKATLGTDAWIRFRNICTRIAISQDRPQYLLHAAVVTDGNGRSALLSGGSGAGKTTVMLGLLRKGWHYVTDDYARVPLDDTGVQPFQTGCTVEEPTLRSFPGLEQICYDYCKFLYKGRWHWTIQPADLYQCVLPGTPIALSHFFFLYPDHGSHSTIQQLSSEEALWSFRSAQLAALSQEGAKNALSYDSRTFGPARSFVHSAPFYRVVNGTVQDTVRLIDEHLQDKTTAS